jgi:YfiH family protein
LNVLAFTTDARDGHARAPGALGRLLESRHLSQKAARAQQIHGVRIDIVPKLSKEKTYPGSDGLLTDVREQPLAIFTADCVPVFLSAHNPTVVGLLHAGWRGVQGRILARAVRILRKRWRVAPEDIRVWVGPSIKACCFEVQWDTARHFPATRRRRGYGGQARWTVDLEGELRLQAKRLGIKWLAPRSLGGGGISKKPSLDCTMHGSRYYSYRRDRTDKRQVSVLMIREKP